MSNAKYIIVGTDIGEELNQITFDQDSAGTIVALPGSLSPEGTVMGNTTSDPQLAALIGDGALNVETIGRLMVLMSEHPAPPDPQKDNYEKIVKFAMTVLERPNAGKLTDQDKAAILAKTEVNIAFESRTDSQQAADENVRILVVPADGTLLEGETNASQMQGNYQPPLSYDLDEFLMLAHLRPEIKELLEDFDASQFDNWNAEILPAILAHAEKWIDENTYQYVNGKPDPNDEFNQILGTPRRAYHRAVGIYGTNMCR